MHGASIRLVAVLCYNAAKSLNDTCNHIHNSSAHVLQLPAASVLTAKHHEHVHDLYEQRHELPSDLCVLSSLNC